MIAKRIKGRHGRGYDTFSVTQSVSPRMLALISTLLPYGGPDDPES